MRRWPAHCCDWYQLSSKPFSNEVVARKPKPRSAWRTSRQRRGWPFGLEASHRMDPGIPVCQIADRDLVAAAEVHRFGLVVLRGDYDALGGVGHPGWGKPSPKHDLICTRVARFQAFPDQQASKNS